MTLIADGAVLMQKAGGLPVELGSAIHERLDGVTTPSSHGSLPTQSAETRSVQRLSDLCRSVSNLADRQCCTRTQRWRSQQVRRGALGIQ